ARGLYVPAMSLHHHVPAARLEREYFCRWWFWKGISKARLEQVRPVTELGVDLTEVPTIAGVPRFMFRTAISDAAGWLKALVSREPQEQMRRAMMLCYFAGYWRGRR